MQLAAPVAVGQSEEAVGAQRHRHDGEAAVAQREQVAYGRGLAGGVRHRHARIPPTQLPSTVTIGRRRSSTGTSARVSAGTH